MGFKLYDTLYEVVVKHNFINITVLSLMVAMIPSALVINKIRNKGQGPEEIAKKMNAIEDYNNLIVAAQFTRIHNTRRK